jgi:hypothetical protein
MFLPLGINTFRNIVRLQISIPRVYGPVPMIGEADTIIMVRWEDESGKIKINDIEEIKKCINV